MPWFSRECHSTCNKFGWRKSIWSSCGSLNSWPVKPKTIPACLPTSWWGTTQRQENSTFSMEGTGCRCYRMTLEIKSISSSRWPTITQSMQLASIEPKTLFWCLATTSPTLEPRYLTRRWTPSSQKWKPHTQTSRSSTAPCKHTSIK